NTGYYSKQPLFDAVWINFGNNLNPQLQNEQIFGLELGYGYHSGDFNANVNLYRTSWKDRFESVSATGPTSGIRGTANLYGIEQLHTGIEFEGNYRVSDKLSFQGMISVGNFEYKGNVQAEYFDEDRNPIPDLPDAELFLDGVKVGDAAQMTARVAGTYRIMDGLSFDASWRYANNLYADIDPTDFDDPNHSGSLELPSYDLVDLGLSYRIPFNDDKQSIAFRLNVNNVFDEVYIAEADTNYHPGDRGNDDTFMGINTSNRVYWGIGRTWNFTMRFNF
ncbi:MAG: TonB-dependent receptor, partial [Urechidicola sp.]|nr:TonB-dependent receptor [Urechidicola sp.]